MLRKDFLWGGAVTAHQSEGGYKEGGKIPQLVLNHKQLELFHLLYIHLHFGEQ